ncbi:MAG: copper resistance protein CopC [Candidatus Rokubacteria bacterium]|nr:copper resistance protein CopC [Candidatus Rokubacteria bacterium]
MIRLAGALILGALALAAGRASAHSLLLESQPPAGAVVPAAPAEIALRFNNRIEKSLSRVRLVDPRGKTLTLAPAGATAAPDRLTAVTPPLDPGAYRVEWQVLSTDGHVVSGSFSFRVAP